MTRKLIAFAAFAVAAVLVAYVYVSKSAPSAAPFASVTHETVVDTLMTNGKAEPIEWVAVHAEQTGLISRLAVQKGQQVSKGAVLVELNAMGAQEELAAAAARIEQARAELAVAESGGRGADLAEIEGSARKAGLELQSAQREVESLQRLVEKKAATTMELNAAKDRAAQAQAQIQALEQRRSALVAKSDRTVAQARLHDAEAAAEAAKKRLAQGAIRSPMDGTAFDVGVRRGDFLNTGDKVASIGQLGRMKVTVYVDEPELGRVSAGMPVVVSWDARAGREWKGTVERVPVEITAIGTRQVGEVVCHVDNAGNELLPGTNVNAAIRSQVVENALTIPKECLRRESGQTGVLLLQNDHIVWQPVKIGISSITRMQVVEGLKDGDRVLLPTDKPYKSGDKVTAGR